MKDNVNTVLAKSIKHIKGVGEFRAALLNKLEVYTIGDAVTYFPREYEDRSCLKKIAGMESGETCTFEGVIASEVFENRPRRGLTIYRVHVKDSSGTIMAVWYNQHYIKKVFKTGERYIFHGKVTRRYSVFEVQNPVYEKVENGEMKNTCRIIPVYPSTADLTQNIIRSVISNALDMVKGEMEDMLPEQVKKKYGLCEINYSISNIHFPESDEDFRKARYRLVFEELLLMQLALLHYKSSFGEVKKGINFKIPGELTGFIENLPFRLTSAQQRTFKEILADMESDRIMNRLVQGDVGSGKTVVAVLALFVAVKNGYQGAFMVPTEILAEQHYASISALTEKYGIKVVMLTRSLAKGQKDRVLGDIEQGTAGIIIGTHALLEEGVGFARLGLVVTDEQHRFGVRQRAALLQKGLNPDVLVMTATPIPRTLALILYGDLDISVIDEKPPGRRPVETYVVDESMRPRIDNFIRKKVAEGRQVYVVCPLLEESGSIEAKSVVDMAFNMARQTFKDMKVDLIHGKMKPVDKDAAMRSFVKGETAILVSTTVIEVGVDVPNATVMIVENAERFGLAQLHQLRGRVGRGEHQSFCILYNESGTSVSKERMKVMQQTSDGFVISEKDLELRGPGEFFGTRQHGIPELRIANLYRDMDIIKSAQKAAFEILSEDRLLQKQENSRLREAINSKFSFKSKEPNL